MRVLLLSILFWLTACAHTQPSIYQQVGGEQKMAEVVDNFITEIEFNATIYEYFKDSDIERFREKLNEHLCFLTGGGCEYTGDTMQQVHGGMNINEHDFNVGVDLFINAMNKAKIPHRLQNKILQVVAPTRGDIIYR